MTKFYFITQKMLKLKQFLIPNGAIYWIYNDFLVVCVYMLRRIHEIQKIRRNIYTILG